MFFCLHPSPSLLPSLFANFHHATKVHTFVTKGVSLKSNLEVLVKLITHKFNYIIVVSQVFVE
jgi:hypothetical protein